MGAQSIATRLFLSATLWSTGILLVAGILLSTIYQRTAEAAFDERLGVYLRAIVADVASPGDETRVAPGQLGEPQFELTLSGWYWQITRLDSDKPDIKASRSLFAARLPRLADLGVPPGLGGSRQGYAIGPDGRQLRIIEREINVGDDGIYLVQVAATTEEIEERIRNFRLELAATFLVLALALVGTTALQVRYGLRPLRLLQHGVAAIRRGESERIVGAFPKDLAPLADELNLLIVSNRDIVERARTHVGNLAHALKTPLSVIVNEAEANASGLSDNAGALSDKVHEQAGVMRHQIDYYLDRARVAARSAVTSGSTDVATVVAGLVRTFEKIYHDRELQFATTVPVGLRFRGERQDLEDMVGNLVDNAAKWARRRVRVNVATEGAPEFPGRPSFSVRIDDDGPGLPAPSREAALRRGRRLDESKPGSGLGLSIVVDLVGVYSGTLLLEDSPLGGLRAELRLPLA
jgi:signal transduction histidine kinase